MRRLFVLLASVAVMMALVVPAGATPDKSPRVQTLINVSCVNGIIESGVVYVPGLGVSGHDLAEKGPAVTAKSAYVFVTEADAMAGTNSIDVIFDRPGKGLDKNTTWCWWQIQDGPPVWFGGDILDPVS